jgi:cytoskeletal protein CcmA (bactofilin family)
MFSSNKKRKSAKIDSLIGQNTELQGNVLFNGGFHIDGKLKGNVIAHEPSSLLTLSDHGVVEGEVRVPNIILNGTVIGDVYASERVELAANAKVTGNVYYNLIEMAMGAEVNGNLVHRVEPSAEPIGDVVNPPEDAALSSK